MKVYTEEEILNFDYSVFGKSFKSTFFYKKLLEPKNSFDSLRFHMKKNIYCEELMANEDFYKIHFEIIDIYMSKGNYDTKINKINIYCEELKKESKFLYLNYLPYFYSSNFSLLLNNSLFDFQRFEDFDNIDRLNIFTSLCYKIVAMIYDNKNNLAEQLVVHFLELDKHDVDSFKNNEVLAIKKVSVINKVKTNSHFYNLQLSTLLTHTVADKKHFFLLSNAKDCCKDFYEKDNFLQNITDTKKDDYIKAKVDLELEDIENTHVDLNQIYLSSAASDIEHLFYKELIEIIETLGKTEKIMLVFLKREIFKAKSEDIAEDLRNHETFKHILDRSLRYMLAIDYVSIIGKKAAKKESYFSQQEEDNIINMIIDLEDDKTGVDKIDNIYNKKVAKI